MKLKTASIYDFYAGEYPINFEKVVQENPLRLIFQASQQRPGTRIRWQDGRVEEYVRESKARSIKYGLYHFLSPNGIAEQAALFLSVWNKCNGADMPPIVDIEVDLLQSYNGSIGNAVWQSQIKTFLDLISSGTGQTPMIYTSVKYWAFVMTRVNLMMTPPPWTSSYPLWVAWYPDVADNFDAPPQKFIPAGWTKWALWQYAENGRSNGYSANDLNIASDWYKAELQDAPEPIPPVVPSAEKIIVHFSDGVDKEFIPK